jgi:hypothetical protein
LASGRLTAQLDAVRLGRFGRLLARVALVDERQLDVVARHVLDLMGQRRHPGPLLLVGGRAAGREQVGNRAGTVRACGPPGRSVG